MAQLQLSREITTSAAIHLLLKSLDVTIPNYDIITQFRNYGDFFSRRFRVIFVEGFTQSRKSQGRRRRNNIMSNMTNTIKITSKADDDSKEDDVGSQSSK